MSRANIVTKHSKFKINILKLTFNIQNKLRRGKNNLKNKKILKNKIKSAVMSLAGA